jgi:AcrR family transcriptional regulator
MTSADGDTPSATDAEREATLDAAASCYLRLGVAKTTAADIAREVGFSRATLYRRFGSHEAIFLAVLTRESEAMAAEAREHLAGFGDPAEQVIEGMVFSIGQIRSRPVHAAVFGSDSAAWAAGQAFQVEALRLIGDAGVRPLLAPALSEGTLSEDDVTDLVDWILRILISFAAVPGDGGRGPDQIRRQLTSWFLPAFANLVRGGTGGA